MKILYWTGAGIGNLIQATPAFVQITRSGHELYVFPEDVPQWSLECIFPFDKFVGRPTQAELNSYDVVIYSEFRGLKNPPVGGNVYKPKMKWWEETEYNYHLSDFLVVILKKSAYLHKLEVTL